MFCVNGDAKRSLDSEEIMQLVLTRLNPASTDINPVLEAKLNPAAAEFTRCWDACHGRHADEDKARVSKY